MSVASVRADRRTKRMELCAKCLDGTATIMVYLALIGGIVLGKIMTNYHEGVTWSELEIPTSLDVLWSLLSSLGFVLAFENPWNKDEKVRAGKKRRRNVVRRVFFAFNTGLGFQGVLGTVA